MVVQYLDLFMVDSDESYTFKCLVRKTGSEIESEDDLMPEGSQNALEYVFFASDPFGIS